MLNEFKQFIMRGNAIDLAVGVVMGAAFTSIVKSIVTNLIGPIIGIFAGCCVATITNFGSLIKLPRTWKARLLLPSIGYKVMARLLVL